MHLLNQVTDRRRGGTRERGGTPSGCGLRLQQCAVRPRHKVREGPRGRRLGSPALRSSCTRHWQGAKRMAGSLARHGGSSGRSMEVRWPKGEKKEVCNGAVP